MRYSVRWITDYNPACRRAIGLPYINSVGKMGVSNVAVWHCHPLQAIACTASTIYQRLLKVLIHRHGTRHAFKLQQTTFEVAAMYAITNDPRIMDRFFGVHRKKNSNGPIHGILAKFIRKLDDDQRFVHRQVCLQTNWLTSRSERPRDKSEMNEDEVVAFLYPEEDSDCTCKRFECPYGSLCNSEFPRTKEYNVFPAPRPSPQVKIRVGDRAIGKPLKLTKRLRRPAELFT